MKTSQTIHNPWLTIARIVWVLLAILMLALVGTAFNVRLEFLSTVALQPSSLGNLLPGEDLFLEELGLSAAFYGLSLTLLEALSALVFLAVAALIFWKRSDELVPLLIAFALLPFGLATPLPDTLASAQASWEAPVLLLGMLNFGAIVVLLFVFPDGQFRPRWIRWLAAFWILYVLSWPFFPALRITPSIAVTTQQERLLITWALLWLITGVAIQIYRYRRVSTPTEQAQTKWIVFGLSISGVTAILFGIPLQLFPMLQINSATIFVFKLIGFYAILGGQLFLASTVTIALLRHNLFDIDALINRALVYGALSATLVLLYFWAVLTLQSLFQTLTGQGSTLAIVIATLGIAALFNPLRVRIQRLIDHRFYRRKYDVDQTLSAFNTQMRDLVDLDQLSSTLVATVASNLQPQHLSLWIQPTPEAAKRRFQPGPEELEAPTARPAPPRF